MKIGLKIDVDTFRGTKQGVIPLLKIFAENNIRATFFFSVGPDNMGRHLWRLFNPKFLLKMLRSNAPGLYGWDILFKGTFWPGPLIGKNCQSIIRSAHKDGHEIGLHAWDHHAWQAKTGTAGSEFITQQIKSGVEALQDITGEFPSCSAAPGWKCDEKVLKVKDKFAFKYNSDCRGTGIFKTVISYQPQVPTTLPAYDEVIGTEHITNDTYNDYIISLLKPEKLNVLTVHAEVEGIFCIKMFTDFIKKVKSLSPEFVPLGSLVHEARDIPLCSLDKKEIQGRSGWMAAQGKFL